mgnify:CR=1 FL=1
MTIICLIYSGTYEVLVDKKPFLMHFKEEKTIMSIKILSLMMAICLVFTMVPLASRATASDLPVVTSNITESEAPIMENDAIESGDCGIC